MEADRFTENGIPAQENCPLAPLSSFRIGGTARLALFPQTKAQLLTCLDLARRENIPFEVVGNGSNLLFPDGVYTGLMIFTRQPPRGGTDGGYRHRRSGRSASRAGG